MNKGRENVNPFFSRAVYDMIFCFNKWDKNVPYQPKSQLFLDEYKM